MYSLNVIGGELYDEVNECFVYTPSMTLKLEHSLLSISKWEEETKKVFIDYRGSEPKTRPELLFYIECMVVTPKDVSKKIFQVIRDDQIKEVFDYVNSVRSSTTIKSNGKRSFEIVTSELIYYWMFSYGIPKECERWHLSRLLKLIEIFSAKSQPNKKMSHKDWASKANAINKARRAKLGSRG